MAGGWQATIKLEKLEAGYNGRRLVDNDKISH